MRTFGSNDQAPARALRALPATLFALGFALAVASRPATAQEPVGTISGKVTASDAGTPLAGATVFVTGALAGALTRGDGTYRVQLRPGRYELRVRLIGWTGVHDSVTVTAGQTTAKDFVLDRSPTTL